MSVVVGFDSGDSLLTVATSEDEGSGRMSENTTRLEQ